MEDKDSHARPIEAVVREFETDLDRGLTQEEARQRLARFGANELTERPRPGFLALLWDQFNNYLVIILIAVPVAGLFEAALAAWRANPTPLRLGEQRIVREALI